MRFWKWLLKTLEITALLEDFGILYRWVPWAKIRSPGIEEMADLGVYRYGALPPNGESRKHAPDVARQIGEWLKTGESIGFPSE